MNNTFLIVAVVVVVWAVLFAVMMTMNKKRQVKANEFKNENVNKAIVHLYWNNLKIDGNDISQFNVIIGENLEKVVAVEGGKHSIEGVFETTTLGATGKNISIKTEKLQFEVELQSGNSYVVGIYDYSPEDRERYIKEYGNMGEDILVMPLSLCKESEHASGCLVVSRNK